MTYREAQRLARETAKTLGPLWVPYVAVKFGLKPKSFYVGARNGYATVFRWEADRFQAQCPSFASSVAIAPTANSALWALIGDVKGERDRLSHLLSNLGVS